MEKLTELGITPIAKITHPAVATVEASLPHVAALKGAFLKNLFVKDKKKGSFLISAHHTTEVSLKTVGAAVGAAGLRMADLEVLQVFPGAVTPLALLNDVKGEVTWVLDERLKTEHSVCVHPLAPEHNTATVELALADLIKFAEVTGHQPVWLNLVASTDNDTTTTTTTTKIKTASTASKPDAKTTKPTEAASGNKEGISTTRVEDFSQWYTEVITRGGMIRYHDISGCYILRPPTMFIWETIQAYMNGRMRKLGVRNASFPLFVSKDALEREKEHIEGFSPEVAWVTKAGQSDLPAPIAIRPTSETIMYPSYADWIRSHRDLPLRLNQWANVVRWEFKQPTPFIRSREFLWQEGHTAHANEEEALKMVHDALDLYKEVYEGLLAVPVIQGEKSENEKFAGAVKTTTIEAFIEGNGRAVQAATSHYLGDHFSKMFDIQYEDKESKLQYALQTSWGLTTRSIGVMIMTHSDDKGLVFPPKVAEVQVAIVPIPPVKGDKEAVWKQILALAGELTKALEARDVRVVVDDRTDKTPGYKYNHWELQGVPLRLEIGAKDLENKQLMTVRRDTNAKVAIAATEATAEETAKQIETMLDTMQNEMLERARSTLKQNIQVVRTWEEVIPALKARKLVLAPWCEDKETEDEIKKKTRIEFEEDEKNTGMSGAMKTLCLPLDRSGYQLPIENEKCFFTGKPAKRWTLWGRSY